MKLGIPSWLAQQHEVSEYCRVQGLGFLRAWGGNTGKEFVSFFQGHKHSPEYGSQRPKRHINYFLKPTTPLHQRTKMSLNPKPLQIGLWLGYLLDSGVALTICKDGRIRPASLGQEGGPYQGGCYSKFIMVWEFWL